MNKCEWKDGEFKPCRGMEFSIHNNLIVYKMDKHRIERPGNSTALLYCPCCGAEIRKPEPEFPIFKKSGETFVAHQNGVDYICIDPPNLRDYEKHPLSDVTISLRWKPISEIEITDELAKLRPMVVLKDSRVLFTLYGVNPGGGCLTEPRYCGDRCHYRLATVSDLKDCPCEYSGTEHCSELRCGK